MHVSCIQAGTLLARLGRPEVQNCIAGLEQYAYAYEECLEQAQEIRRVYAQATAGQLDLGHMASVVPRPGPGPFAEGAGVGVGMSVDGLNGHPQHQHQMDTQQHGQQSPYLASPHEHVLGVGVMPGMEGLYAPPGHNGFA